LDGHKILISKSEVVYMFETTTHCPICGVKLATTLGKCNESPSLDRIDNENEIRSDNVWIICNRCNSLKRDMTMREYIEHSRMIAEKFKEY